MWLLRSSRYECKASSCEVERYNNMSSGKLVGSGVSVSSGASASMGFDQGGIVAPADGRRSMEVRRLYLDSTRLSANTVPWLGCDNVSMYDPSWRASRSIDEVALWQIAFFRWLYEWCSLLRYCALRRISMELLVVANVATVAVKEDRWLLKSVATAKWRDERTESARPMMRSWLRTSRTLYHSEYSWVCPVESAMATVRISSKLIDRDRESPRRTKRSVWRLSLVIEAARRCNSWRETKLLPCAPVSSRPLVNQPDWWLIVRQDDESRTDKWLAKLSRCRRCCGG